MIRGFLTTCVLLSVALAGCGKGTAPKPKPSADQVADTSRKSQPENADAVGNIKKLARLPLSAAEVAEGWISLFDGESLFGWLPNSNAKWRVEDGVIVCDSGDRGLLQTSFQFADYELRCDFKLEPGGNSGLFLRTTFDPANPAEDCYELNMCDTHDSYPTGSLVGRVKAKGVPKIDGQWHSWHVKCLGKQIVVKLDDVEVINMEDGGENQRLVGHIGLQMNKGRVEFRSIALRPLNQRDLFDGSSLSGWSEVPGGKSKFEVADGELCVTDGAGFLETNDKYGDFILQAQVKPNGIALNSGIFFRAIKGTAAAPSHGYEMQIQNGVRNGDPTKPADAGTGAIFRRQTARRVNGRDKEWTTLTLIAQGDHIGSWVNGYQVVDWKDEREPNENPRKGLRLESGHISLQGHDPTTDLRFRNICISDAPFEK